MEHTNQSTNPSTDRYADAQKPCDIVMKGGITSGVVYPLAACELAETYFFKNIGGTSAGAIAAGVVAAAEYRRRHGDTKGFAEVEQLPDWLGKDGHLFNLFQPCCETKPVFEVLCAAIQGGTKTDTAMRVAARVCRYFWDWALLGAIPGLILALSCLAWADGFLFFYGLVCASVLILIFVSAFAGGAFLLKALKVIPGNFFGICRGSACKSPNDNLPLTDWLTGYINRVAGLDEWGNPLTFGLLWDAPQKPDSSTRTDKCINLEVMTTNLTHGRPYRIPFDTDIFSFHPDQFAQFFPKSVVDWMVKKSELRIEGADPKQKREWEQQRPFLPLPLPQDLPIVVAVRMSLSFPILLSAVPLYAVDWSRKYNHRPKKSDNQTAEEKAKPDPTPLLEKCWFSDGGICSNLPVHFFDQLLPQWPTFALNLRPFHPDYPPDPQEKNCNNVRLADGNNSGILEWWNKFDAGPEGGKIFKFLGAIITTMQNWVDNTQIKLPGYRDRVAHICHTEEEGGMNLNMPEETITKLQERGLCAGKKLRENFNHPNPADNSWLNHRWVRYRSTMALLEKTLRDFKHSYRNPVPPDSSYTQLITRGNTQPPDSYPWKRAAQEQFANQLTNDLVKFVDAWDQNPQKFGEGSPNPQPELRVRPKV